MKSILCKDTVERKIFAVGLSFASASLLNLEALHADHCLWLGLNADQSFALSATLATLSVFLGSIIVTKLIAEK